MVEQNVGGRDRLLRAVLAVVLGILSLNALRGGKRKRGVLAGGIALGLGLNAVTCFCGLNRALGIDTAGD